MVIKEQGGWFGWRIVVDSHQWTRVDSSVSSLKFFLHQVCHWTSHHPATMDFLISEFIPVLLKIARYVEFAFFKSFFREPLNVSAMA